MGTAAAPPRWRPVRDEFVVCSENNVVGILGSFFQPTRRTRRTRRQLIFRKALQRMGWRRVRQGRRVNLEFFPPPASVMSG